MSQRKKIILWAGVAAVITAIILAILIRFTQSGKPLASYILPTVGFVKVDLTDLSAERANLLAHVQLHNPAPVGLSIDSLSYTMYIQNKEVVKSMHAEPVHLKANGSSTIRIPVTIYYKTLDALLKKLQAEGKDSTTLTIQSILYSDLIPADSAHIHTETKIPVITIPDISVHHIHIDKLTGSGAVLNVAVLVTNHNNMSFSFSHLAYTLKLSDHKGIDGTIPDVVQLPAKDSVQISFPVQINFKEMSQGLVDLIKKGRDLPYDFTLKVKPETEIYVLKNSELELKAKGTIGNLSEATEK